MCLKGASSSLGLICCQAVETSILGNWTPLRSRLVPIPFKGGLLFDGEILQQVDCLDKEEVQLKKARSFGSRWGYLRNIFRGHSRGDQHHNPLLLPLLRPPNNLKHLPEEVVESGRDPVLEAILEVGGTRAVEQQEPGLLQGASPNPSLGSRLLPPPFPSRFVRGGG